MIIPLLRRLAVALVAWAAVALAVGPVALAQPSAQITPADAAAINVLASQLSGGPTRLDAVLAEMRFPRADAVKRWPGFDRWPPVRQIETAYLSAIEGGGSGAGDRFLETMSRIAVEDVSAAMARDPALSRFVDGRAPTTPVERTAVKFALPAAIPADMPPAEVRAVVMGLEKYLAKPPGGVTRLLAACCVQNAERAYALQRESSTVAEALTKAILQGDVPPELRQRLLRSLSLIAEGSGSIAYDRALQPYLAELNARDGTGAFVQAPSPRSQANEPTPQEWRALNAAGREALATAAVMSGIPQPLQTAITNEMNSNDAENSGGGGAAKGNAQRHESNARSVVPSSGGSVGRPTFRDARISTGGWGGVLFGNVVTSKLPSLRSMTWSAEPSTPGEDSWGRLDVEFADGRIVFSRRMRAEDLSLAVALIRGGDGLAPLDVKGGEAVGLAGYTGDYTFAVHPAIFGYSLADAAILADARAFMAPDQTRELISTRSSGSKDAKAAALSWLRGEWGFYKITDAPLEVVIRDEFLVVERAAVAEYAPSLRRIAFLSFQGFDTRGTRDTEDDLPLQENGTSFYPAVPALISAIPEFARLKFR